MNIFGVIVIIIQQFFIIMPMLLFRIFSAKKDWLPSGLFQFGNISFPAGDSYDKTFLHFYCMSLKKSDGTTYAIKLNKEQLA